MEATIETLTQTLETNPNTSLNQINTNPNVTRRPTLTPRRKLLGVLGMSAGLLGAGIGLAACEEIPASQCPRTAASKQCYIDNTGVRRVGAGSERLSRSEIIANPAAAGLTVYNGDFNVYQDGITISRMAIFGCVGVHADNVTIEDSYIQSDHACTGGDYPDAYSIVSTGFHQDRPDGSGAHNLVIRDSEIFGMNTSQDVAAIGQDGWKAGNVRISGSIKGVRMDHDNVLLHSIIYNLSNSAEHGEGVFIAGGPGNIDGGTANINIIGNYIEANSSTGGIALLNNYDADKITIEDNYVNGQGGAGITGGAYKNKNGSFFTNVVVRNNVIDDDSTPEGLAFCGTCTGNIWTGNVTEKGVTINVPIPWQDGEPYNPADVPATP